ncbi:hypothetical protein ACJX0J_010183, partial [Zea mays]
IVIFWCIPRQVIEEERISQAVRMVNIHHVLMLCFGLNLGQHVTQLIHETTTEKEIEMDNLEKKQIPDNKLDIAFLTTSLRLKIKSEVLELMVKPQHNWDVYFW